ncbi:ATP-binding protein [Ornithinimicrobium cavernae]|uniref:ATP-binding protein n=1 Tax=Ornithinimicrobium cavernae TaxID=2666047 RepID=UPI000D68FB74|nr:ATP-binding protein [Ornithinimicrobium cavernae]
MERGELRIYLGAAPGVGKTVSLLAEGERRRSRGSDVVIGVADARGRAGTAKHLHGLPDLSVPGRDGAAPELDLTAVLRRRPQVVLVDDLAHRNPPGSRHARRWQDVEELLAAGIDVVATVNIQHLESLADVVESITGSVEPDTVPDEIVRRAGQVELVDMTPQALRRRLAHGNIVPAERVDAELADYYRVGNLTALRELALLWLADRVEESLSSYRRDHGIRSAWATRERIVVALSGSSADEMLLRRGARIAARGAGGELLAVHVTPTDHRVGDGPDALAALRRLCEELGGTLHVVTGDDAAESVLRFAEGVNASAVLLGSARRRRWWPPLAQGVGERVIAGAGDLNVYVVTHPHEAPRRHPGPAAALPAWRRTTGFVVAVLGPALVTALLVVLPWDPSELPLVVQIYLLVTIATAVVGGIWPALTAAVLCSLATNWFFTSPVRSLAITDPIQALAVVGFVVVALVVSLVVHRSARRAAQALSAQRETASLAELSQTLLGAQEQLPILTAAAARAFGADGAALVRAPRDPSGAQPPGRGTVVAATPGFEPTERYAAAVPVDESHQLVLDGDPLPADQQRLLTAYAAHAAAIISRTGLQREAESARALARDNRARTALLSAVSHDLRTPLAGIKAAIGSLRSTDVEFGPEDRAELMGAVEDSADRLEHLINNLLDMSRVQVGALVARPAPTDLGEVVPGCIAALSDPGRVPWELGPQARWVLADPGLLDRVLGNLLENALRHAPAGTPVRVVTSAVRDRVEIRVVDTGPGVPAAELDRIFLPFQRRGDAPEGPGHGVGLGLAVARGLAEAMEGTVEPEATPGGGLTMVVALPALPRRAPGQGAAARREAVR